MNFKETFKNISNRMNLDLQDARSNAEHSGIQGDGLERAVRVFLRKYLPNSLDVSTGKIIDSLGNKSKQLDVIISDKQKTPIFYNDGENRILPVECVYFVIEVKSYLKNSDLVGTVFENMASVKNLEKKAYIQDSIIVEKLGFYSDMWDIWPINYYVFAVDSDVSLESLTTKLIDKQNNLSVSKRIDSLCILNKGVIMNQTNDGMYDALPQQDSNLVYYNTEDALLLFYSLLSRYFNQARMPYFEFKSYLQNMSFSPPQS